MLCPERRSNGCELPTDEDVRELALHLIATHHGFGRPHFSNPLDQEFETAHCEAIHTEAIRRFAHLQRKYGWWQLAWLENLLRCADALASADDDAEDDPTDAGGDEV
jgi:CRISPR-associated endonuclease/helicase Cas3